MHKQVLALHQQKLEMASYNWHHWNWIIDAVTNQVLDGHYQIGHMIDHMIDHMKILSSDAAVNRKKCLFGIARIYHITDEAQKMVNEMIWTSGTATLTGIIKIHQEIIWVIDELQQQMLDQHGQNGFLMQFVL